MGLVEDFGRGAVENQRLQRLVVVAALLAAGEELAVGKSAGAALAESVVGIGVDASVAVDLRNVDLAGRNVAAALQQHGAQAQLDQPQSSEQSGRSGAHDNHGRTARDRGIVEPDRGRFGLAVHVDFERKVDLGRTPSCVDRAFDDPHQGDVALGDTHAPGRERGIGLRVGRFAGREDEGQLAGHLVGK